MDIFYFKVLFIALIITVALVGGYYAFKIKSSKRSALYFSLGNTFAAGIFFGAGLIHMLPDASEGFADVVKSDFPFAAFVASMGFLLILFIEKIMLKEEIFEHGEKQHSSPYILILILSIHSIIAGIALGTEDQLSKSFIIAIAILAHKGSASFALAISMIKGGFAKSDIAKLITMFSFMTPLGIFTGSFIANILTSKASEFSIAMFDALAAGTFLYIAIMEIFNEEFEKQGNTYLKLTMSVAGVLVMALLALWL